MDNNFTDLNIKWIKTFRKDKLFSIIHYTYQPQKGKIFYLTLNKEIVLTELWDWAKQMSSLPFENRKNASLICHLRKDLQGIVYALKTEFPELRIKEYHSKSNLIEKVQDFSNVEESWKGIDLVAYTTGIVVSIIEFIPKLEDTTILLSQTVKVSSSIVKAEKISDISNAFIVNYETAELLENKLKKTLE
ncbi:18676_t:CDS:2 [Funneliformis geosporum]|nr:18676_t:CDS:2 [Funneliformis geosporum]